MSWLAGEPLFVLIALTAAAGSTVLLASWIAGLVVLVCAVGYRALHAIRCRGCGSRQSWRSLRRWRRGECERCGYSLVENESGVCPECGLAVGARKIRTRV